MALKIVVLANKVHFVESVYVIINIYYFLLFPIHDGVGKNPPEHCVEKRRSENYDDNLEDLVKVNRLDKVHKWVVVRVVV